MYEYVADTIAFNILPSLLNSLSKDGFDIWQVTELDNPPSRPNTFLVIARKLIDA